MTPTCQKVLELLADAADRPLAPAELELIDAHARTCGECAALLRLQQHLDLGPTPALEAAVPDATAAAVWDRLAGVLRERPTHRAAPAATRRQAAFALAAAAVALALLAGWLGVENHRLRARVIALEEAATAPGSGSVAPELTAAAWRSGPRQPLWDGREVTVEEAVARLRGLPPAAEVLAAGTVDRLLRDRRPAAFAALRRSVLAEAARSGLRAGEALAMLTRLDPDSRLPLSRATLRDLTAAEVH